MYVELLVAALATFVWLRTDSEIARHLLYNLMVMASISTLVFNVNPLMRFDGYFILSDLLEIPNLYAEGARAVRRHVRWLFLGESSGDPCPLGAPAWLMALYGWSTAVWRVMVCVSLTVVASVLFHGAGIVIAAAGVLAWIGLPLLGVARELARLWGENRATFWRCTGLAATLAGCATLLLCWMPAPARVSVPGVVEYHDVVELRSLTPGFVREIFVADGQNVQAGDLLMRLENPDVSNLYHDLLLSIEQAEQRYRLALDDHEISAAQVEQRNRLALEERLVDARRRFEALQVRAPVSGEVIRRSLAHTLGTYVDERAVLLSIANERSKELVVSVSQQDFDNAVPSLGDTVYVRLGSQPRVPGRLVRLEPRASTELPHAALAASDGGSLAVVESRQSQADRSEALLQLTEPRFRGIVSLPPSATGTLFSGQRGQALIGWHREPWGVRLIQSTRDWIERKKRANREA
jgi:putative peptide zinc metalloprotease protein